MEFEIKNVKCVTKKAGVSLVTVLLFMLVATIAATATYKWITSEGRSSATRMMEREAYQSSIAGIENARAWMTFHANETGALIRQYIYDLSTEGTDPANVNPKTTRTPINLDKHIRSFAQENSQNHHVWLVGVNTTPPTYKVKILSEGLSRDGRARHTEVAIFNVNGLYQVEKPKKTVAVESDLKFDYAYFGGSYLGAGNVTLSSAVVNGDWHGNPQTVTGNFVVTGNATLSGNSVTLGPLSCIGGNFYPQNNGATGKDFYIGGNAVGNITTTDEGNVYFDGDYANAEGGSVDFTGSVTLNGRLVPYPTLNFKIHGNLCTTNDGIVVSKAGSDANDKPFVVDGNVWMPGIQNVAYGNAVVTKQGCVCDISSPAWSDPPSIVQQNVSCDGEEKSYWNDGTYGNDSYKTIPTGCASIEKTIEMGDNHDFYQKILLGGAGKDVYIRSARKSADYSALAKNYSEEGKRNCSLDSRFKVIASNNWERDNNKGPFYKKMNVEGPYVCGTLYPPSTDGVHEYMTEGAGDNVVNHWTYYTDTWQSWTTATDAEVFPSHGSSSDKYYIFDNSVTQTNFVKFEQRTLNDWREIKSGATQQSDGKYHIPMWQSDNDKFDLYFNNSYPKVGAYKTGNQYFYDVTTDENNYYNYSNSKITGSPYCMNSSGDESKYRPSCGVTPWFKSNGKVYTKKDTWPIKPDFKCAEDVKENCKKIWGTKQASKKCGADYFVPDQIVTGFSKFKSFAQNECAKDIKYYGGETNDDKGKFVTDLNTCWRTLHNDPDKQKTALYNDFLVVEVCVHDQQKDACGGTRDVNPTGKLKGNFIIIINGGDKLGTNFMDIEDDDTHVFYYLKDGIGKIADATRRNTFIYSEGEIADGLQFNLTGTIYTAASTCAGLGSLQSSSITSDPTLNNLLANAGIICNNDGSACGGNMSSGTGSGTGATTTTYGTAGKDSYFISMAPQLGVTLESQYETSEAVPTVSSEDDELKKSFIVLPRIIYLTRDADGKLSDYYNIVPLNGANVTKNSATVSCSPSLNLPPSNLVTGDSKLDDGLYTCNATATGYSKVPFYVWVQGTQSSSPPVNFLEPAKTLDPGEPYEVKINLPPHATGISVKVNVSGNTEWITSSASTSAPEGSTYTFEFGADATGHSTPTIFTVTPPANTTNGVLVFSLLTPEPGAGYYLGNPWSTSLNIATTTTLTNTFDVTSTDIGTWCTAHASVCPGADVRSSWPDCPYKTSKEWVVPDWISPAPYETKNTTWSVVTGGSNENTLSLKEKEGSGCIVIIPSEDNSYTGPIVKDQNYTLRAVAKASFHQIKLKFVGDVGTNIPYVDISVSPNNRTIPSCYNSATDRTCTVSVFDGEKVKISVNDESSANADFSYWLCKNNGGTSCPTTDPLSGFNFGGSEGFALHDDNAVVEIHFGEHDKHCFFDEFRRTRADNTTHSCGSAEESEKETEYCIGTGTNAKWKLAAGGTASYVEKDSYQGYLVASSAAPKTGVKIMSTVDAGVRGTLKALFSPPHATVSYGNDSPKIKNSGFMLRSDAAGTHFFMLNVYEDNSGYLAARLCLDGGSTCTNEVNLLRSGARASVTTSSMVMLSAKFKDENTLELKAYKDSYYNNGSIGDDDYYKATFSNLGSLMGDNHASMTYQHVGLSLADRDFKVYGIGWESDDYDSECFDGPPAVKCSFAAVAVDGIIPLGQQMKPWVGHSGGFESENCTDRYYYYNGGDVNECSAIGNYTGVDCGDEGLTFSTTELSEVGAHGYTNPTTNKETKTVKASLSCSATTAEKRAWATTMERAHCGPFWTGQYDVCKVDASLLNSTVPASGYELVAAGEWSQTFTAKNLRGIEDLAIVLSNEYEYPVDVEVWLESNSDRWGGTNYESRHGRITGSAKTITKNFRVAFNGTSSYEDLSDNATGFDPEHVVAIVFKNNGSNAVKVKSAKANCTDAVRFKQCKLARVAGQEKWKVSVDFDKNGDKVTEVAVSATVGGDSDANLSKSVRCNEGDCSEIYVNDADIYKNAKAGKEYEFSVTFKAPGLAAAGQTETCTPKISPDAISCDADDIANIESGARWPDFNFTLGNCPSTKCKYKVTLSAVSESTWGPTGESADGSHSLGYTSANAPDCTQDDGCEYTYRVESTETSHPFSCSSSFIVNKKGRVPLTLTCSLDNLTDQTVGSDLSQSANKVSATGCDDGETCTWSITQGGSTVGGGSSSTFPSSTGYTFSGSSEAGTYSYVFTVTRGSNESVSCTNPFTVSYPLNLSCGTDYSNPGDPTPIAVGDEVTLPSVSGENSGCNGKCTYTITGGGLSNVGGDYIDDMSFGTFSDNDATGTGSSFDVDYTLNIYKGGTEPVLSCSPLTVTYAGAVTPSTGCHCEDYCGSGCNNIITGNYDGKPIDGCYFVTDPSTISFTDLKTTGNFVTINGTAIPSSSILSDNNGKYQPCWDSPSTCESALSSYPKKDGGWYIYAKAGWAQLTGSGDHSCPISVTCPADFAKKINSGTITARPQSVGNCGSSGCNYTVWKLDGSDNRASSVGTGTVSSGGNISLTSESKTGAVKYELELTKNGNSDDCTFEIDWNNIEYIPITVGYGESKYGEFSPGDKYSVSINGGGGVFRCIFTDSPSGYTLGKFNNSSWSVGGNSGGQATTANPGNGSTVIFEVSSSAPSDLKCGTDW